MRHSIRSLVAALFITASAMIGTAALTLDRVDPGMSLGTGSDAQGRPTLVIQTVQAGGLAWYEGARPGDIVVNVDGTPTLPGDQSIKDAEAGSAPQGMLFFVSPADLPQVLAQSDPHALGSPVEIVYIVWAVRRLQASVLALGAGFLLCVFGFLWRRSASPGPSLTRVLPSLIAASATPLFLLPAYLTLNPLAIVIVSALVAGAALLAAADVAKSIEAVALRRAVLLGALATAAAAAIVGGLAALTGMERGAISETRWALAAATVVLPGLVAARSLRRPPVASQLGRTIDSIEVGVAASLPAFALMPLMAVTAEPFLVPVVAWVVVIVVLRRFAIRPIANVASRAGIERSLVVDDSEAERRRIASDIHDDVIQDLTMLVHRLDRDGANDTAAAIRRAVGRLRAICADLRLPVLDDLGLGPAIHSLVAELGPEAHGEIRLELRGDGRLPAEVELALFRIAQESVVNAVKHGKPPIAVSLDISAGRAELQIDDSGSGIRPDVLVEAPREGHMGLLNMTQRADQIGATLEISSSQPGGTRIRVVWVGSVGSGPSMSESWVAPKP